MFPLHGLDHHRCEFIDVVHASTQEVAHVLARMSRYFLSLVATLSAQSKGCRSLEYLWRHGPEINKGFHECAKARTCFGVRTPARQHCFLVHLRFASFGALHGVPI